MTAEELARAYSIAHGKALPAVAAGGDIPALLQACEGLEPCPRGAGATRIRIVHEWDESYVRVDLKMQRLCRRRGVAALPQRARRAGPGGAPGAPARAARGARATSS